MQEATRILHHGEKESRRRMNGAVNPPVVHASLFGFESYQAYLDFITSGEEEFVYSRVANPTVRMLEDKIADLEGTERAIAVASGMAAITPVMLALLKQGDHLLMVDCVYGPARDFATNVLGNLGVEVEFFTSAETLNGAAGLAARLRPQTRLVYLESPGSLHFALQDFTAVAELCRPRGIVTMTDNTWSTPLNQKPHQFGIDVMVHSGTKYIAGHSDLVLGLIACSQELYERIKAMVVLLGATLSPADAYLALRGLRTLPLRMAQHHEVGLQMAHWLNGRPEVARVLHPALAGGELAAKQLTGYSGLFSFVLQESTAAAIHAFTNELEVFTVAISWGSFESLILPLHHAADPQANIDPAQMRISLGLEAVEDLMADLERGFEAWRREIDKAG